MKVLVFSYEQDLTGEHEVINALFENGLEALHLRKPLYTKEQMEEFLRGITPRYLKKVVLHSHYQLIERYNVKGIHLTRKYLEIVDKQETNAFFRDLRKRGLKVSASIHSLDDELYDKSFDYLFLSPIFDSISKAGYHSKIDKSKLKDFLTRNDKVNVVALGGIDEENVLELKEYPFEGIALLGAIWEAFKQRSELEDAVEKFKKIQSVIQQTG